ACNRCCVADPIMGLQRNNNLLPYNKGEDSMDRRTAACVAGELMLYPTYKLIVEEGVAEAAQRAHVWFSDASIRRYGAYDMVLAAVSALEANERYQRAAACVR